MQVYTYTDMPPIVAIALYNEICNMAEMQYGIKDLKLSEITPLGNDIYRLEPENRKGFEPSYVDVKVYEKVVKS